MFFNVKTCLLHENPSQIPFDKSEQNPDYRIKLQDFRDKVAKGRLVRFWKNAEELPGIVALSLSSTIKRFPAIGWVRANKVANETLLEELNELRKENAKLKQALAEIEPSIFTSSEDKDFSYIYNKLNRFERIEVTTSDSKTSKLIYEESYLINLASLIPFIPTLHNLYHWIYISKEIVVNYFPNNVVDEKKHIKEIHNISSELLRYGFLTQQYVPPVSVTSSHNLIAQIKGDRHKLIYSEKFERFKYWLDVNGKMPEKIEIIKKDD